MVADLLVMRPLLDLRGAMAPFATLTDEEVVTRVLGGETALFEVLMRRHNQRLFRTARAIVRDSSEAEDVMQEAYVRAFAQLAQFEGRATWATWLTRIAVNEALARVRRRGRFVDTEVGGREDGSMDPRDRHDRRDANDRIDRFLDRQDGSHFPEVGPEDQASARELVAFLERAVDALPDIYRTVFVLREVEGLSTADTASSLEISEELVKVRLHRARGELRRTLETRLGSAQRDLFGFHLSRCDRVVERVLARIGRR